jgi:hypothetical protein
MREKPGRSKWTMLREGHEPRWKMLKHATSLHTGGVRAAGPLPGRTEPLRRDMGS